MADGTSSGQAWSMLRIAKSARGSAPSKASGASTGLDTSLRAALGYRVESPDGDIGVLAGVPYSGRPPRPLVLVVRDGDCIRFVSVRRVRAVSSAERRVLLGPVGGEALS